MKDIDREISKVYNYNYADKFDIEDNEQRRIYLNCEIDESIVDSAVYHILRYNRLDKDIPIEDRIPIKIYINSPGGSVSDGYALIDAIRLSKTPVYTINLALAASMGFLIFIAGHKRYCMPHAEFLMHDGSTMGFDSTAKMRDRMEFETVELEKETRKYIMSRTNIDENLYIFPFRLHWDDGSNKAHPLPATKPKLQQYLL